MDNFTVVYGLLVGHWIMANIGQLKYKRGKTTRAMKQDLKKDTYL